MSEDTLHDTQHDTSRDAHTEAQDRLYPEDQAKVDAFLKRGVNSVERRPFKPLRLLFMLIAVVMGLSIFSQLLARWAGIY